MPPVGCCTFLTLESTTTTPVAITAPAISVVRAQAPRPPSNATVARPPTRRCHRIARWLRFAGNMVMSQSVLSANDSQRRAAGTGQGAQHLVLRTEFQLASLVEEQDVVHGS